MVLALDRSARGEPMRQQDQQSRQDGAFDDAEHEAVEEEQGQVADKAGAGGEQAPGDHARKDQALGAVAFGIGGAGHLEQEIAEEEQRPQQGDGGGTDMQVMRQPSRCAKTIIGAVDIGEAVGDEDRREAAAASGGKASGSSDQAPQSPRRRVPRRAIKRGSAPD